MIFKSVQQFNEHYFPKLEAWKKEKLDWWATKSCPSCGRLGAILWNEWNQAIQCHHCGYVVASYPWFSSMKVQDG